MKLKLTPNTRDAIKGLLVQVKDDRALALEHEKLAESKRDRAASNEMLALKLIAQAGADVGEFVK